MICWLSATQAAWVVNPHPPNEESATTLASPVASKDAVIAGELSCITLSPTIQTRNGSLGLGSVPARWNRAGVIGASDGVETASEAPVPGAQVRPDTDSRQAMGQTPGPVARPLELLPTAMLAREPTGAPRPSGGPLDERPPWALRPSPR